MTVARRCWVLVLIALVAPCSSFQAVARPGHSSAARGRCERDAAVCAATSTAATTADRLMHSKTTLKQPGASAIGAFRASTTTTATTSTAIRRRRCFSLVLKAGIGDGGGEGGGDESRHDPAENATSGDEPGNAYEGDSDSTGERMELRDFRARLMSKGLDGWGAGAGEEGGEGSEGETGGKEAVPSSERWAHPLVRPELGCLIIAKENLFTQQQQYFYRAVMLVIQHDEDGTVGLILNRPTTFTMGDLCTGSLQRVPGMEDNVLYMGGYVAGARDDGLDVVNLMHGRDDVPGMEVVKGLRLGGLKEALALVAEGKADPEEFKFFSRYSGWGPGQLEAEMLAGNWVLAACDLESVLRCHNHPDQPGHFWNEIMSRLHRHKQRQEEAGGGS